MENNKPLAQREPTPYPKDNAINNISEIGPLNSVVVPPLKKALELVNLEINNKIESEPEPMPQPEPMPEPKFSIVPSLMEAENLLKERELTPFQTPTPFDESIRYDSFQPQKEIIIEEYIIKKPSMPLLEEESMTNSMELIPNVRRSRKSKSRSRSVSSPSSIERTRKYKRCKRNHRRSKKTHHCNKHCPPGHRKNPITKSCRTIIKN